MSSGRMAIASSTLIVLIVVVLIVVAGIVAVTSKQTTVSVKSQTSAISNATNTVTSLTQTTSSSGSNGLLLQLKVNTTSASPSSALEILVSEYNTRSVVSNISAANLWKVGSLSLGPCGNTIYPFGVEVLRGWYSETNASLGQPLQIFPLVPCPLLIRLVGGYLFQPSNDSAVVLPGSDQLPILMASNVTIKGTYSSNYSGLSNIPLAVGTYTIVAGDEWGALTVLHFVVTSTASSSSSTSQNFQGIITGYVTVGPSQPVCQANQSCNVDMAGYSLEFASSCPNSTMTASCQSQTYLAQLSPGGHYSVLLAPGNYEIVGLSPSCPWMGCSTAFPEQVVVVPGEQIVVNIAVDTGIR